MMRSSRWIHDTSCVARPEWQRRLVLAKTHLIPPQIRLGRNDGGANNRGGKFRRDVRGKRKTRRSQIRMTGGMQVTSSLRQLVVFLSLTFFKKAVRWLNIIEVTFNSFKEKPSSVAHLVTFQWFLSIREVWPEWNWSTVDSISMQASTSAVHYLLHARVRTKYWTFILMHIVIRTLTLLYRSNTAQPCSFSCRLLRNIFCKWGLLSFLHSCPAIGKI